MKIKVQLESTFGKIAIVEMDDGIQLTPHFSLHELANASGDKNLPMYVWNRNVEDSLIILEDFRNWYAKPMTISSNFRQVKFNAQRGGTKDSLHLKALAYDWWIPGHTEQQRQNVVNEVLYLANKYHRIPRVNFYTNGYHIDWFEELYGYKTYQHRDLRGQKGDW